MQLPLKYTEYLPGNFVMEHRSFVKLITQLTLSTLLLSAPLTSIAEDAYCLTEAFKNGETNLSFRLRHESAKQNALQSANATTLRSHVTYETEEYEEIKFTFGVIDVSNFFGQDYNPAVNGLTKAEYSKIADPKGTGVTQANFSYLGFTDTQIIFGRQPININNQRFIGTADFRQFPQRFDGLTIQSQFVDSLDIFYSFLTHVNSSTANGRADEGRRKLRTHLFNVTWDGFDYGNLSGYLYFNKDRTKGENSHAIVGLRATPSADFKSSTGYNYLVELAEQQGKFNNPKRYHTHYFHAMLGTIIENMEGQLGYEILDGHKSETNRAFQTPMGTNHKFQGLADAFLTTPNRGIQDFYCTFKDTLEQFWLGVTYHHFRFASGGGHSKAGNEFDLFAGMRLAENVNFSAVYAKYNGQNNAALSTKRFWAQISVSF